MGNVYCFWEGLYGSFDEGVNLGVLVSVVFLYFNFTIVKDKRFFEYDSYKILFFSL